MANGYYEQLEHPADGVTYRRVPDSGLFNLTQTSRCTTTNNHPTSEFKFIKSTTHTSSTCGRAVEVHDHFKARIVDEPRASQATSEDYKRTQQRKRENRK
jgi:hypothetical protein